MTNNIFSSLILIFLLCNFAYSKVDADKTEIFSSKKNYKIVLIGSSYNGFHGRLSIVLFDSTNRSLWQKTIDGSELNMPLVSNNGDVALTRRNSYTLYDNSGSQVWKFESDLRFWREIKYNPRVPQIFSEDGSLYFTFLQSNKSWATHVVCFSVPKKKELWRISLEKYYPSEIFVYKNNIFFHDFYISAMRYTNHCYVIDFEGQVRLKQKFDSTRGVQPNNINFDYSNNEILIPLNGKDVILKINQ